MLRIAGWLIKRPGLPDPLMPHAQAITTGFVSGRPLYVGGCTLHCGCGVDTQHYHHTNAHQVQWAAWIHLGLPPRPRPLYKRQRVFLC